MADEDVREELAAALEAFDETQAQALLDDLVSTSEMDALLGDLILPYLHELGERWACGEITVAQEHFASNVVRGRLLGLSRGWSTGFGPLAVLASLPGEQHDLGLIAFGLALRARGWRIVHLGADAPLDALADTCERLWPSLVVVQAVESALIAPVRETLRALADEHRVALGGAAARDAEGRIEGVLWLSGDVVAEATRVTRLVRDGVA
jgi:methanogenic corrinoid protein MtbC1